jgi:hypothetical protein
MAEGGVDRVTRLGELRDGVQDLLQRVTELGRHL